MSKSDNLHDFFFDLANAIRAREGSTDPIYPRDMARRVAALADATIETTPHQTLKATLADIANAIRVAEGSSSLINPQDMSDRIMSIVTTKSYTVVEYIESSGTQWIDTGVLPTTATDFEFVGAITENTKTSWIVGAPTWYGIHKKAATVAATQWSSGMTYMPIEVDKVFKIGVFGNKAYFDGVETNSLTRKNATKSLFMFAYHHTDDTGTICSSIRMCSFKMWNQGTLVRDFTPVLDHNNVACLYDKVSNNFFYNQGRGAFLHGKIFNEYTPVEYLEANGTQWIDTGLLSSNKSQVDVVFSFSSMTQATSNNAAVFGGRDAQTSRTFTLFQIASTNPQYLRFDYNGQRQVATSNQMAWEASHKYRFVYNGVVYETTNLTTGEVVSVNLAPSNLANSCPISLFAVNTLGTRGTFMKGRIYRYTYTDGVSSIDLIPALDKKGVPCMYDTISGRLFYNQGTGDFLVGQAYKELEYIESTGAQWIDTGYSINTATDTIEFAFQNVGTTIYKWIMGEHDDGARFGIGSGDGAGKRNVAYGATTYKVADAQIFNSQHIFISNESGVFLDGTKIANFASFASTSSIYLFNLNLNSANYCGSAKVWGYKHYRNGILIRDFIPVLDKDDTACMYDKVSGEFFYNSGTGEFIAGDIKK